VSSTGTQGLPFASDAARTVDLDRNIIFVALAGSQAHGTGREGSDVDVRGVFVAPVAQRLSLFRSVGQLEGPLGGSVGAAVHGRLLAHHSASRGVSVRTECVLSDVAKFLSLCAAANPNALEVLFADERDWMYETPAWRRLHRERYRFLSQKVQQTYLGYAMAQLKRIGTHRSWLLRPPKEKPAREAFGLPDGATLSPDDRDRIERSIADRIRSYGIDTVEMPKAARLELQDRLTSLWRDLLDSSEEDFDGRLRAVATHALHLPHEVEAALDAERKYRAAMKHWDAYRTWEVSRNPARAELERRHGYDTKHAMHLVRLMRTGLEVLETGELRVRRPDADDLNAIRDGSLTFDELITLASELQGRIERAAARTALPADVDLEFVDRLALELILAPG
jgi:predicted nucleotidyltransferase